MNDGQGYFITDEDAKNIGDIKFRWGMFCGAGIVVILIGSLLTLGYVTGY